MTIPESVQKEIEKRAEAISEEMVGTQFSIICHIREAITIGYELAHKQLYPSDGVNKKYPTPGVEQPPASGREFFASENRCTGRLNIFHTQQELWNNLQGNENEFKVREVTPRDAEREKAVQGLVEALEWCSEDKVAPEIYQDRQLLAASFDMIRSKCAEALAVYREAER